MLAGRMDHFAYRNGQLHCEDVSADRLAESFGTPAFIYSAATLRHHYSAIAAAFAPIDPLICYSIKSCGNLHICRLLRDCGSGFDVVSGGELRRALEAGADPEKIVFAGVGKTDEEMSAALDARIGWLNIESPAELEALVAVARRKGVRAKACLRVNPDVDPKTHRYTTTGKKETKFGVDFDQARRLFAELDRESPVQLCGLHVHIGSPVNEVAPYVAAVERVVALIDELRTAGHKLDTLDIGGGFGAHYRGSEAPPASKYAEAIVPLLAGRGLKIILEPGRSIAANAGILLTRVIYTKTGGNRKFAIVDAGMTELIRPALYEAYHFIWPARVDAAHSPSQRSADLDLPGLERVDVVGPVCESGDFLAKDRPMPPVKRGDLVAVFTAGAYGMSMASHYNSRPNPAEILVEGSSFRIIRRRETYDDLVAAERV
jgi:diaminopimelate decarboxylase